MTLELRISTTLHAYESGEGKSLLVKKILVGTSEADQLFEKAKIRTGQAFSRESQGGNRLQYQGMSVYVVDQESYLWFAP